MRKLFLLAVAASFTAAPLSAQSWADALKNAAGSVKQEAPAETASGEASIPSAKALRGTWIYRAPAMDYTGDDMLAAFAVGALKDQMAPLYAKAGLESGRGTVRFADGRRVTLELGTHRTEGTYAYDARSGRLSVTLSREGKTATFEGAAALADGVLTLLFDARQALDAIGGTPEQVAQNEKLRQICAVLEKYPGIRMGCRLSR